MTDLIMNLVDSYGFAENRQDDGQALYARNLVEVKIAELNAERDALELRIGAMIVERSDAFFKVIQERDALALGVDKWRVDFHELRVERDGLLALHTEQINYTVKIAAERDALKEAARLALDALQSAVLEKELYLVKFDEAIRKLKAVL